MLQDLSVAGPILLSPPPSFLIVSWRLINMHSFADFLIATEAEMKKVAWSSKKRLFQDTVVVLTTVLLMTLFFLFVDFFWSWLLSQKYIGVLPSQIADGAIGDRRCRKSTRAARAARLRLVSFYFRSNPRGADDGDRDRSRGPG